jgi:3-oxoacyl-[acyl-carrier-protein] synthase III
LLGDGAVAVVLEQVLAAASLRDNVLDLELAKNQRPWIQAVATAISGLRPG